MSFEMENMFDEKTDQEFLQQRKDFITRMVCIEKGEGRRPPNNIVTEAELIEFFSQLKHFFGFPERPIEFVVLKKSVVRGSSPKVILYKDQEIDIRLIDAHINQKNDTLKWSWGWDQSLMTEELEPTTHLRSIIFSLYAAKKNSKLKSSTTTDVLYLKETFLNKDGLFEHPVNIKQFLGKFFYCVRGDPTEKSMEEPTPQVIHSTVVQKQDRQCKRSESSMSLYNHNEFKNNNVEDYQFQFSDPIPLVVRKKPKFEFDDSNFVMPSKHVEKQLVVYDKCNQYVFKEFAFPALKSWSQSKI